MKVSPELKSQLFSNQLVAHILSELGMTSWEYVCKSEYELITEAQEDGIWVCQEDVVISYTILNDFHRSFAQAQGEIMDVEKTHMGWLVESVSQPNKKHFVRYSRANSCWVCTCMRYRCWKNRLPCELPPFWEVINHKPYCRHIAAAYSSLKVQ